MKGYGGREKLYEAADFLINLLAGTEMPSVEVYQLAKERGISSRTLERAKLIVGARSRPVYNSDGKRHVMTVSENMKGQVFGVPKSAKSESILKSG